MDTGLRGARALEVLHTLEDRDIMCKCFGDALGWAAVEIYMDRRRSRSFSCGHCAGGVTSDFRPMLSGQTSGFQFTATVDLDQGERRQMNFFVSAMELFQASQGTSRTLGWELVSVTEPVRDLPPEMIC